jgi:hypothetical protein
MSTPKKKRRQADQSSPITAVRGQVLKIHYAPDETGPAELLDERLARIIDVPALTDDFWRDDVVRLQAPPWQGHPSIAEVFYTRFERRSRVEFFGGDVMGAALRDVCRVLGFDSAIIVPSEGGRPGIISVAHIDAFDPAALVNLLGADKAHEIAPAG